VLDLHTSALNMAVNATVEILSRVVVKEHRIVTVALSVPEMGASSVVLGIDLVFSLHKIRPFCGGYWIWCLYIEHLMLSRVISN
jgi:hypothetical protein